MLRSFFAVVFLALISLNAFAESVSPTERTEFQRLITAQITAFQADNGQEAYDYSAPVIHRMFPSVEIFMGMVKQGYPQVYRPQSYKFNDTMIDPTGRPAQKVSIVGPDGKAYMAVYTFEKQPDGTWLISGCTMMEIPGVDA